MVKSTTVLRCCLFVGLAMGLLLLLPGAWEAEGKTITVDDDGGADYETIQDAVNAASKGDTISVWGGVYNEHVVVNKSLSLVGNGRESTTINSSGSGAVVKLSADWCNFSGFKITRKSKWDDPGIDIISDSNHIFENSILNNKYGIALSYSSGCIISNNTMNECGVSLYGSLEHWNSHTIETSNTVNGKPVHSYKNATGFTVPLGAGQIILANCSGIRVEDQNCSNGSIGIVVGHSSNITISNNTCSENRGAGILLYSSSDCTLEGNTVEKNHNGIWLRESSDCTILNNSCSENSWAGIYLSSSSNGTSANNVCENNYIGIHLTDSSGCTIKNNTCSENSRSGISFWDSSNCTITNNSCSENRWTGIWLWNSVNCTITNNKCENNDVGIYFADSEHCMITDNSCSNSTVGIELQDSDHCTITNNECSENNSWADIYLLDSKDCTIKNNKGSVEVDYEDDFHDGYFLPGFGATLALLAFLISAFVVKKN